MATATLLGAHVGAVLLLFQVLDALHAQRGELPFEHELEVVPRALALLFVLAVLALRRVESPRREQLFACAAGLLAGATAHLLFIDGPYGLNGTLGDAGLCASQVTHYARVGYGGDATYDRLAAFYPPLWFWLLGRLAVLLDVAPPQMVVRAAVGFLALAPPLVYALWARRVDPRAAALAALLTACWSPFFALYKPFELASLILFVPWWLTFVFGARRGARRWWFYVQGGLLGGLLFQTFYYWFFIAIAALPLSIWIRARADEARAPLLREALHQGAALALVALFAAPYLVPLARDALVHGVEPYQHRWIVTAFLHYEPFSRFEVGTRPGLAELVAVGGFLQLATLERGATRALGTLLVGALVWLLVGYAGIPAGRPVLLEKTFPFLDHMLVLGFALLAVRACAALERVLSPSAGAYPALFALFLALGSERVLSIREHDLYELHRQTPYPSQETEAFVAGRAGDVFLDNSDGLHVHHPVHAFVTHIAHYSHFAARFSARVELLQELRRLTSPASLAWFLRHNPFDPVDVVWLEGSPLFRIYDDAFPHEGYRKLELDLAPLAPLLADSRYFERHTLTTGQGIACDAYVVRDVDFDAYRSFGPFAASLVAKYADRLERRPEVAHPPTYGTDDLRALATSGIDELINRSQARFAAGDYAACAELSEMVLATAPASAIAYNNLCAALNAQGEHARAAAACERALELEPGWQLAQGNLRVAREELAHEDRTREEQAREGHAHESPERESPERESPERESPERESPERESPERESPERESPARESPARESPER